MFGSTFDLQLYQVETYQKEDSDTGEVMNLSRKKDPEELVTFTASAISIQGATTLDDWVRERHVTAVELASRGLPDKAYEIAVKQASDKAATLTWNSSYGAEVLGCIDGMILFASCILNQNHPELTKEALYDYLVCPENLTRLGKAISKASLKHPTKPSSQKETGDKNHKKDKRKRNKAQRASKRRGRTP